MSIPLVEVTGEVGKSEHHEQERQHDPEPDLVSPFHGGHGTAFTGLAVYRSPVDTLPRDAESDQRHADEDGPVGLENLKIGEPGSAHPEAHENQGPEAASSRQQGGDASESDRTGFQSSSILREFL